MIAVIPGGAIVQARARSADAQWIEIVTEQGIDGWVKASEVYAASSGLPTQIALAPSLTPTAVTLGDLSAMEHALQSAPIFENLTTERVRAIYAQGQGYGNRADVFTTVGDSNTTNGDFLQPIGMNADAYCTWGSYGYLRAAVDFFGVPPAADESNSFTHHSMAARKGFNSASALDPFWVTDAACSGASPLLCEYATVKPGAAIIMLGNIDVSDMPTADYAANMRAIVQQSIQQGVIPVLTTFVVVPERDVYERSLEFNLTLLQIAAESQVPLINLWAAAQTLPDHGIGPDQTHLKAEVGSFCSFDGAQQQYGGTLRNLLTLQALDQLRQNVLGG